MDEKASENEWLSLSGSWIKEWIAKRKLHEKHHHVEENHWVLCTILWAHYNPTAVKNLVSTRGKTVPVLWHPGSTQTQGWRHIYNLSSCQRWTHSPHQINLIHPVTLYKVWPINIHTDCQAVSCPTGTQHKTMHKYLWQVGEVRAVVRAWAMGSPLPNSFSCCYGNCVEKR